MSLKSVRQIFFIRHGETEMNAQLRCQGSIDIPLDDEGREQMARAGKFFKTVQYSTVFSSPLIRAKQSAEIVTSGSGLDVKTLEWIAELNHGKVEGMNTTEIEESYPGLMDRWRYEPHTVRFPDGESLAEVALRVKNGLTELTAARTDGNVLLVTHQVISGVARCIILGLPLTMMWENKLLNGGHFHFYMTDERIARIREFSV